MWRKVFDAIQQRSIGRGRPELYHQKYRKQLLHTMQSQFDRLY